MKASVLRVTNRLTKEVTGRDKLSKVIQYSGKLLLYLSDDIISASKKNKSLDPDEVANLRKSIYSLVLRKENVVDSKPSSLSGSLLAFTKLVVLYLRFYLSHAGLKMFQNIPSHISQMVSALSLYRHVHRFGQSFQSIIQLKEILDTSIILVKKQQASQLQKFNEKQSSITTPTPTFQNENLQKVSDSIRSKVSFSINVLKQIMKNDDTLMAVIEFYETFTDELYLLYRIGVYKNKKFGEWNEYHSGLSWFYDIIISVYTNVNKVTTLRTKLASIEKLKLLMNDKNKNINTNEFIKNQTTKFSNIEEIDIEIQNIELQLKKLYITLFKLTNDFIFCWIDVFGTKVSKYIYVGTGFMSACVGLTKYTNDIIQRDFSE